MRQRHRPRVALMVQLTPSQQLGWWLALSVVTVVWLVRAFTMP